MPAVVNRWFGSYASGWSRMSGIEGSANFEPSSSTVIQPIDAPRNTPAITSESQCPLVMTTPLQRKAATNALGSRKRGATSQTEATNAAEIVPVREGNEFEWGPPCRNLNPK